VPASAAPSPTPSPTPTPPPASPPRAVVITQPTQPTTPQPVGDGQSGADYLQAEGQQTHAPAVPPPASTTPAPAPAVTPQVTSVPATAAPAPAHATQQDSAPSGSTSIPRDGLAVLVAVLIAGLAVSVRAIRGRERRIGWALMAFCLVYMLVLGGLVTGVAGAAIPPPSSVAAIAGDGEVLVSFDPPIAPNTTIDVARSAAGAPASCVDPGADELLNGLTGPTVDSGLVNGRTYYYSVCADDGSGQSASVVVAAKPVSGIVVVPPVSGARAKVGKRNVTVSWRNPGAPFDHVVVVRKLGSRPTSLDDGELIADAAVRSVIDHPLSSGPVWFAIFAADSEDTLSDPVYVGIPKFDPALRLPYDGQVVGSRPRFSWRRHAHDYYDIQIFRASASGRPINPGSPLIDSHPRRESFTPRKKLRRGRYVWYLWAHTTGTHFAALGSQTFVVG
jgi:hypothetical protein